MTDAVNYGVLLIEEAGYKLLLLDDHAAKGYGFKHFVFDVTQDSHEFVVTGRDFSTNRRDNDCYHPDLERLTKNPTDDQVVEVGAGLGIFIPELVKANLAKTPIVIDPANYGLMYKMLREVRSEIDDTELEEELDILIERCEVYISGTGVKLIKTTFEKAINEHQDLIDCADIIVDNFGALRWYDLNAGSHPVLVGEGEARILKEGGLCYQNFNGVYRKVDGRMLWNG